MKYLASIRNCADVISKYSQCISDLEAVQKAGLTIDPFIHDGSLYENDDGTISKHLDFYQTMIEDTENILHDFIIHMEL